MSSLPLRISGHLLKKARWSGVLFRRSISQQVEYWTTRGRRLEAVISVPGIAGIKGLQRAEVDQSLIQATCPLVRERLLASLTILLSLAPVLACADPIATAHEGGTESRLAELPDFYQEDPRGGFVGDGSNYCCPVAVSNSLLYFARHGYPNLLASPNEPDADAEIDLIRTLYSPGYFGTDPGNGTAPTALLRGLRKYVQEKGYACQRLEYEGWRKVSGPEHGCVIADLPQIEWLKAGIRNPDGAVWLNIGWYAPTSQPDEWKRIGGHWVTVGAAGKVNQPNLLFIHNPAINRSRFPKPDPGDYSPYAVELTPAPRETLFLANGFTRDTTGMYAITGRGLPHGKRIIAALLDAAVVFVIGPGEHRTSYAP